MTGSPIQEAGEALISGQELSVGFGGLSVLESVSLSLCRGQIVTLVGPNGSGKSTLVKTMLDLIEPQSGRVIREPGITIGYVPQTVQIDPTLPLSVRRFITLGAKTPAQDVEAALKETGAERLIESAIQSLSGGELRRVLLARALAQDPDLLVLDEPTAGVDAPGQIALYRLIAAIRDRRGCGVLLVSHNLHLVMAATDHVVCLNRHICCEGRPDAITRAPEYLSLFGQEAIDALALYPHQHDHHHDLSGDPVPEDEPGHEGHHHG